ncbi:hypothetical protein GCM10023172_28820 [Hymenobacter ginsengisoli]|uniref:HYR domain-containing protein n=1 Tax=Hymenobacter ginsengisoli TaxID=1051626 RepID=A0ABP8QHT7_9BACT|nr:MULTISPECIES: hypothetical protein [unclassified Hymenobacter]MBO2029863.1 hypothetical protein [Hymenobacter sp. BT559]
MRLLLVVLGLSLLAGCGAKTNGPLALYFVGSSRFTTGNKTNVAPGDTLATNLYALANGSNTLQHFRATVTYTPQREPFAYPTPITAFFNNVPADPEVTYLDSTFTGTDFLYTPVFGVRTTAGTERWTFTATDKDGNTSARAFVLSVRRSDSLAVYHDYTLKLRVPASGVGARRFIDLKSGLALPAYSVVGSAPNAELQQKTDVVVLPDGLRLASPDTLGKLLNDTRWPAARRSSTRFRLTALSATDFTSAQDTITIQSQFTGAGRAYLPALALNQVYAFRATRPQGVRPLYVYGLLLVRSVPNGTSSVGLQLEVRLAKQRRRY